MRTAAPDKKLCHTEFAVRLQAILEPERIERRFKSKKGAADYVREVAKMVGGRDCLAPPKMPPLYMQKRAYEQRIERVQRVRDAKRKASKERIGQKIAKADREVADRIEACRAEMQARLRPGNPSIK
jgi:hypothetical protein